MEGGVFIGSYETVFQFYFYFYIGKVARSRDDPVGDAAAMEPGNGLSTFNDKTRQR